MVTIHSRHSPLPIMHLGNPGDGVPVVQGGGQGSAGGPEWTTSPVVDWSPDVCVVCQAQRVTAGSALISPPASHWIKG